MRDKNNKQMYTNHPFIVVCLFVFVCVVCVTFLHCFLLFLFRIIWERTRRNTFSTRLPQNTSRLYNSQWTKFGLSFVKGVRWFLNFSSSSILPPTWCSGYCTRCWSWSWCCRYVPNPDQHDQESFLGQRDQMLFKFFH